MILTKVKITNLFIASVLLLVFGVSCAKKSTGITVNGKSSELNVKNLDYEYLSTKGKLVFKSAAKDQKLAIDTRIQKDKQMWMSMRVAKIEGLRVLATQDSVFALDKMGKEAYVLSYDDVELLLGTKIDYDLLQSIFTGDLPQTFIDDSKVKVEEEMFSLTQKTKLYESSAYVNRSTQVLEEIVVKLKKEGKIAVVDYKDFKTIEEGSAQIAPFQTDVFIGNGTQKSDFATQVSVNINLSKIEVEEGAVKMPFKIPSKYKIVDRRELERRNLK